MKEFIKMAFRNLLRHKRRSLITGFTLFISGFIFTFGQAYCDGIERQIITSMIASNTGHIMITTKRESKDKKADDYFNEKRLPIKDSAAIIELVKEQPGVTRVSEMVVVNGVVSNGTKMNRITVYGIRPKNEQDLLERIIPADHGSVLNEDDSAGIYISHLIAGEFNVGVGDDLTIVAQSAEGSINSLDLPVKGIFKKNAPWLENSAYVSLATAQTLVANERVDHIKVMLNSPDMAKFKAAALRKMLGDKYNVEIRDWKTAGSFGFSIVSANKIFIVILWIVLFIVVAAMIINTMLMVVFERTKEIGTMMAIGMKRAQILALIITEAVLLSLMAAGLGVLLGSITSAWLGFTGIPAFNKAAQYAYGADRAYPYLTVINIIVSYLSLLCLAVIASIYPALRAVRLKPVKALNST